MYSIFESLKCFFKTQSVTIDNNVFRLHYKVTIPILVAFSIAVTANQFLGEPIQCMNDDKLPEKVVNLFCWTHATFSVHKAWTKKVGSEVSYPGVDKYVEGDERVFHAYYQWVCFVLFLQALLFYLPRYFWKGMEGGRIKSMVQCLNSPIIEEDKKEASLNMLVTYMTATFNRNNMYAGVYFLCEVLNVVNVIGQIYLIDTFLGGTFTSYGTEVLKFTEWDPSVRYDPMLRVFPRVTKCTLHTGGSSGDVKKHDALCILPLNIMNEKIYVFLWFWFVFIAVLSCVAVVYRILLYASPAARFSSLKPRATLVEKEYVKIVLQRCQMGDWFLIHLLSKNMNSIHFRDFMAQFAKNLAPKKYDNETSNIFPL